MTGTGQPNEPNEPPNEAPPPATDDGPTDPPDTSWTKTIGIRKVRDAEDT
jgi:hypothetical protein